LNILTEGSLVRNAPDDEGGNGIFDMTDKPWKSADELQQQCHAAYRALKDAARANDPAEVRIRLENLRELQRAWWEELNRAVGTLDQMPKANDDN